MRRKSDLRQEVGLGMRSHREYTRPVSWASPITLSCQALALPQRPEPSQPLIALTVAAQLPAQGCWASLLPQATAADLRFMAPHTISRLVKVPQSGLWDLASLGVAG